MTKVGTIAALNRYPVKSMQGEAPDQVELDTDGIVGDRSWALRDVETDKLVSAKRPRLWRAMLDCRATGTGSDVTLELPDGTSFGITDPKLPVILSELFGREVTIEEAEVPQQGSYASDWPEIEGLTLAGPIDLPTNITGAGRSFVDVEVLHLLTTASLAALGQVGPEGSDDPRRFRPSILIETPDLDGFIEDEWTGRRLSIGEVELAVGDPTPRCIMTTVEQEGMAADPGVLRTLAEHHRVSNPLGTFACLGSYASVTSPGVVRVGDTVELV